MNQTSLVNQRLDQVRIEKFSDGVSRFYDLWGAAAEARARQCGIELAAIRDGESLLDVATGTGLIMAELIRANCRLIYGLI